MQLYHNIENDLVIDVNEIHHRQQVIQQLKKHFRLFGYREIHTSPFEAYDLYVQMNGTVNHEEMIKTIDNTGKALVLRPDITIPLTQQIASHNTSITEDLRYFYVLDVFRQKQGTEAQRYNTQAGIEYFGNPSPEADAEVIFLAIDTLKQMRFKNLKMELGHAGFFARLIDAMQLKKDDLQLLKQYIQAKNIPEIEQFLKRISLNDDIQEVIMALPFLYGEPQVVLDRASELPLPKDAVPALDSLRAIYDNLRAYGVEKHVVIDLSLINHMDYYSDMIFQGFIENIGKPIVMGGRYDSLAAQFEADIPASGFAYDLDTLVSHAAITSTETTRNVDVKIMYDGEKQKESVQLATKLRKQNFETVLYPKEHPLIQTPKTNETVYVTTSGVNCIDADGEETLYTNVETYTATKEKE